MTPRPSVRGTLRFLDVPSAFMYCCAVHITREVAVSVETTYTHARAHFAELCTRAAEDREVVIIRRRNAEDVALIAADELSSLVETAHLLRSPANAERLLTALARARGRSVKPQSVAELRAEVGVGETA